MASSVGIYIEGTLQKRPRARTNRRHVMWFQERFCQLTPSSLQYYEMKGKKRQFKGRFEVEFIRIVEKVPNDVFRKKFCFQVGYEKEVMYLAASDEATRTKWMEALRQATADSGNKMLQWYHNGVFGKTLSHPTPCWSCCKVPHEKWIGCKKATGTPKTTQSLPNYTAASVSGSSKTTSGVQRKPMSHSVPYYTVFDDESDESIFPPIRSRASTMCTSDSGRGTSIRSSLVTQCDSLNSLLEQNEDEEKEQQHHLGSESMSDGKHVKDVQSSKLEDLRVKNTAYLCYACRKGLMPVVQDFLEDSEVNINLPGAGLYRTPLHMSAMAGHSDIVKLLLENEADPFARDINNETPYDLAMKENHKEVMDILQDSMLPATATCTSTPPSPPSHLASHNVKALVFYDDRTLISTSMNSVQTWDLLPDLTLDLSVEAASEFRISSLSVWNTFLAVGSNCVQTFDFGSDKERVVYIADEHPLLNPPMHLVAFGPRGHLATVNSESKTVKVWPPPSQTEEYITEPIWTSGSTLESVEGSVCSFSVSTSERENKLWLAIGTNKGHVHVQLLRWQGSSISEESHHTLHAGEDGGTSDEVDCRVLIPHSGRNVATSCGTRLLIWEIESATTIHDLTESIGDGAVSSLCYSPNDVHLAVGMSTGEVMVYLAENGSSIITLEGPEKTAISSMAYSGNGGYIAAGYDNGKIQIWTTSHFENSSKMKTNDSTHNKSEETAKPAFCCSDLPLIGKVEDEIQSREEEYIMEFLGYKIVVPANATHEGKKIPFQTGEMPLGPVGPFKFPPNTRPVSSIVWLHSKKLSNLQKPIKIVLSHCLDCTSEDDLKQLVFMKAGDNDFTINEIGEKEFHFHIVQEEEREGEPKFTEKDGTLTTRYNCWYAISSEQLLRESREEIDRARYCLTQAVPKYMTEGRYEIRFILSYYLESCMKVIETQYSGTHKIIYKKVTFSTQGSDRCIRVEYERNLPNGWIVTCPSERSIEVNDVYFLGKDREELELDLKYKQYPPNIVLDAHGGEATGDAVLEVRLTGADKELKREVHLSKSGPEQIGEAALTMDAVKSLSECSSYGITTATQTVYPIPCTEGNTDAAKGQHYPENHIPSLSPAPQQPSTQQAFLTQYEKHRTHNNDFSSSSQAQSMEADPAVNPLQESDVPSP